MIIETKANELLNSIHFLSKISRRSDVKSLLIEANGEVRLFAYSSDIYGQRLIDAKVIDPGRYLLPLSIIPYLSDLKDADISLQLDLDKIIIKHGRSDIELNQIGGTIREFSKRETLPDWIGTDLVRLSNLKYASVDNWDYDVFWFNRNAIISSDRVKVAIYKPKNLPDIKLVIPNDITSYFPDGIIDLSLGDVIYFGNDKANVSITTLRDTLFPKQLEMLVDEDFDNVASITLSKFLRSVSIIARLANKDNITCKLDIAKDECLLTTGTSIGEARQEINLTDTSNFKREIHLKLNSQFLRQVVDNCNGPQILIGTRRIGNLELLFIHDYDICHYLVPYA